MSQQEDDLRALSKIMDLLRGVSIAVMVANIYWFCQPLVSGWEFHSQTLKVLRGLDEAGSLFHNPWNANGGRSFCLPSRVSAPKVSRTKK